MKPNASVQKHDALCRVSEHLRVAGLDAMKQHDVFHDLARLRLSTLEELALAFAKFGSDTKVCGALCMTGGTGPCQKKVKHRGWHRDQTGLEFKRAKEGTAHGR